VALDFPNSPALNDTYTLGARTWKWNGSAWDMVSATTAGDEGLVWMQITGQ
jgi:hypothetical protein